MRGGGSPAPPGRPGGMGGPPGPGRFGIAGAGRPVATGCGGARLCCGGGATCEGAARLGPPGEGGSNLIKSRIQLRLNRQRKKITMPEERVEIIKVGKARRY